MSLAFVACSFKMVAFSVQHREEIKREKPAARHINIQTEKVKSFNVLR